VQGDPISYEVGCAEEEVEFEFGVVVVLLGRRKDEEGQLERREETWAVEVG